MATGTEGGKARRLTAEQGRALLAEADAICGRADRGDFSGVRRLELIAGLLEADGRVSTQAAAIRELAATMRRDHARRNGLA
jgi:hypothetical protein